MAALQRAGIGTDCGKGCTPPCQRDRAGPERARGHHDGPNGSDGRGVEPPCRAEQPKGDFGRRAPNASRSRALGGPP
eukprot:11191493-Lingulodinium_polyedra.AAC.1